MLDKQAISEFQKLSLFKQARLSSNSFFSIMSLACMRITNHFHPNHFALKQRLGAARKLPINLVHLHSELVVIKALVVIHGFWVNYAFFFYFLKHYYVCRLENSRFFFIICFAKTRRAGVRFSRKAREPHTPLGLLSLFVFTLSLQSFGLTAHGRVLNLAKNTSCFAV